MKILRFIIAVLFIYSTSAADAQYTPDSRFFLIDASHSELRFSIDYMVFGKVSGSFENIKGLVYYDGIRPEQLSTSIKIDAGKLNTGNTDRDNDLKKNWFDVEKFPFITFETKKAVKNESSYTVSGSITIKGISKEITLTLTRVQGPVKDIRDDEIAAFEGSTKINRKDFGINRTNWDGVASDGMTAISDQVTITFTILGKLYKEKNYAGRFTGANNISGLLYNSIKDLNTKSDIEGKIDSLVALKVINGDLSLITVANYSMIRKNNAQAKILLEKAKQLYPASLAVKERLLEVYYGLKDTGKLKTEISEILSLDTFNPVALEYQKH